LHDEGYYQVKMENRCSPPRHAFTLIEVLLTLALIMIISAVAWVALKGPVARQRLRAAADAVRTAWVEARVDAMKTGHTFAFRYRVRGDRYHLAAQENSPSADSSTATQPSPSSPSARDEEETGDEPLPPPVDKTLPPGIRFLSADATASDLAAMGDYSETKPAEDSGKWSDPIYFYADGSTTDARVVLAADRHAAMQLLLRGITGSVTVDDDVNARTQ
jgi:prepilin-type N-terminal cleavage/methylation domain-containing protein